MGDDSMLGGDVMRQRMVAERGYTNHPGGMYSDKFTHPKLHCEAGRYISIGDPYVAEAEKRPGRWKEKQMGTTMYPKNAGNGYFGNMGKPFEYMPDKYVESLPYAKSQPYDQRKLGFGTHDASKRDEYTQAIKTEQYRDLLRREKRILSAQEKKKGGLAEQIRKAHKKLAEAAVEEERQREVCGLTPAPFLYDIGRSRETPFDPKTKTDCFYNAYQARKREMRRGGYRSMSQDIGDGGWELGKKRETFGRSAATKSFYSKSHLEAGDI
jgi:hypothetical protein